MKQRVIPLLLPLQSWISLGLSNQIIKRAIGEDSEVDQGSPIISCFPQLHMPGFALQHLNAQKISSLLKNKMYIN